MHDKDAENIVSLLVDLKGQVVAVGSKLEANARLTHTRLEKIEGELFGNGKEAIRTMIVRHQARLNAMGIIAMAAFAAITALNQFGVIGK